MLNNNIANKHIETKEILLDTIQTKCFVYDSVTSTLDIAHSLSIKKSIEEWSSVLAYNQTSGRGQQGHTWHSSSGNMYATLVLPKNSFFNTQAIAPIIGGIIINFLKNLFYENIAEANYQFCMKWTNDLLIKSDNNYFKIGGILVEEKENKIYAGIGINIQSSPKLSIYEEKNALIPSSLSNFIDLNSFFLNASSAKTIVNALWERLVFYTFLCYQKKSLNERNLKFDNNEFDEEKSYNIELEKVRLKAQKELLSETNTHLAYKQQKVRISDALVFGDFDLHADNTNVFDYTGIVKGISLEQESLGGIIIDTNYGLRTFLSGSIRAI